MRILVDPLVLDENECHLTIERIRYELEKTFDVQFFVDDSETYCLIKGWVKKK